jgi:pyridoxine 5-phosphate synthase
MIKLGVNVDHIATIRQVRLGKYPSPLEIAILAEEAGADGITIHLREDRRHIQAQDVIDIKKRLKTKLNLEMALDEKILELACKILPSDVCLVPEKRQELTTEGGLDVKNNLKKLDKFVSKLKDKGICVSIFVNPEKEQILLSKKIGAAAIELHTGKYANSKNTKEFGKELQKIKIASEIAVNENLILNAGHGLNYENVREIAKIKGINELNIGHSIISYAFYVGIQKAVSEMKKIISKYQN